MRRCAVVTLACLSVLVLVSAAQAAPSASLIKSPIKSCGSVTGAGWVFPGSNGKLKGNTYGVTAVRAPCTFAKHWAVELSGSKLSGKQAGKSYALTGGPKGYKCTANPDADGKLLAASCLKGSGASTTGFSFGGAPKRP